MKRTSRTGKAASEIIKPTTQPQAGQPEQPRHIDHNVKVLHVRDSEMQPNAKSSMASSSSSAVVSDTTELEDRHEEMRKGWINPESTSHTTWKHLKREPFQFSERVQYNVQFPNRAAIQIQRLLGTTKVQLNDPEFVLKIQDKLGEEEDLEGKRKEDRRIKMEYHRLRKLVVDGIIDGSMLPPELQSLAAHPAVRATQILKRMDDYDRSAQPVVKPNTKITPVEPYEFNGDKYFKHVHTAGDTNWVPKRVRKGRKKVPKIKESQDAKASKQKPLRTVFKRTMTQEDSNADLPRGLSVVSQPATELASRLASINRDAKYDMPDKKELELYVQEQMAADDAREKEERRSERKLRERSKYVEAAGAGSDESSEYDPEPNAGYRTSLQQLQQSFGISDLIDSYQNTKPEDEKILKQIEDAQDVNEVYGNAEALNNLYAREIKFADNFPFQRFNERFHLPYEYSMPGRK